MKSRSRLHTVTMVTVVGSIAAVVLSACSGGSSNSTGGTASKDSITVAISADITSVNMDPDTSSGGDNLVFLDAVFRTLFDFSRNGTIQPDIATKDVVSDNGLLHTLTIRKGVKFQNGQPVTAEDVAFTINRARGLEPGLTTSTNSGFVQSVKSADAVNTTTVAIHLTTPDPTLDNALAYLPGMVLPEAYVESHGNGAFGQHPIGAGPYEFVSHAIGQSITLRKFSGYNGPSPAHIDNVKLQVVTDTASALADLQSGSVDFVVNVDPSQIASLRRQGFTVTSVASGDPLFITLQTSLPELQSVKVRQAMNYAINKDAIIKTIYQGAAQPLGGIDTIPGDMVGVNPYPYDPAKAKQLIKESGVTFDTPITFTVPEGRYVGGQEAALVIQAELKQVGIPVNIVTSEYGQWVSNFGSGKLSGMTYDDTANILFDGVTNTIESNTCGQPYNLSCEKELDTLYAEASPLSGSARTQATLAINQYTNANPPAIFLWQLDLSNAYSSDVKWDSRPGYFVPFLTDISFK
jgi:peptide/nickel transport system substrate-binding protein